MAGTKKTDHPIKKTSWVLYYVILAVYLLVLVAVNLSARRQGVVIIAGNQIPMTAFTGVFSSIANICIIFFVVFFNKPGFITALVLLTIQFPMIARGIIVHHNLANVPGFFGNLFTIFAAIAIYRRNRKIERYQDTEMAYLKEQQKLSQSLFEQTARALVNAIDAKDSYSHGHSLRVAEYSEKIARMIGKDDDECYKIYYTALLHDVGKIGINENVMNKSGKLTNDEYEYIKGHSDMGDQILNSINEYPYLSIGAHFHHERYDGKGYPLGLKGEDIPEVARIISVADAYDAMTSNRSYRTAIPQDLVREEIVKGAGTQFDPEFAKIMLQLIDQDTEYDMKEKRAVKELAGKNELICGEARGEISEGIIVTGYMTSLHMRVEPDKDAGETAGMPSIILFDALDGRYHDDEKTVRDLMYFEYCEIWLDGRVSNSNARRIRTNVIEGSDNGGKKRGSKKYQEYDLEAVKQRDHVLVKIYDGSKTTEITVALPDSSRFVYIGLTGEHCRISNVSVEKSDNTVPDNYIPRIAEEISFIEEEKGDIPNVQVDGPRTDASVGIPIANGMKISFHTMSLPTSRLIWHCPYIVIFSSDDERVYGENYKEYALVRLDGEDCENNNLADNRLILNKNDDFEGWDAWKNGNRAGLNCTVSFERKGNRIVLNTENLGVSVRNTTTIKDGTGNIYAAITGDQCALTDIEVTYPD